MVADNVEPGRRNDGREPLERTLQLRTEAEERGRRGISDGLVRISLGVEDPVDVAADLEQALAQAG